MVTDLLNLETKSQTENSPYPSWEVRCKFHISSMSNVATGFHKFVDIFIGLGQAGLGTLWMEEALMVTDNLTFEVDNLISPFMTSNMDHQLLRQMFVR